MLRGYALTCDIPLDVSDFWRVVRALRTLDWVGIRVQADDDARKLAEAAGITIDSDSSLYRGSSLEDIGVAEVFFRDGDMYYFELVNTAVPRSVFSEPEEIYYALSSVRRRPSGTGTKKDVEVGIVSSKDGDVAARLKVLAADIETAASSAVDGRRVRHFTFNWSPRRGSRSRIGELRERFASEDIALNIVKAELGPDATAAADILAHEVNRSLLVELKIASFARESDVLARRGTKQEETKGSLEILKAGGLVKPEYLLQCRKSSALLVRVDSPKDLQAPGVAELPCATCSRKFKDELVAEGYSISDLGKAMSDGSHWMTVLVTQRLTEVGVPLESIFWNLEESGEEVDIMVDFMGELWLIELKDREFGAGDAHPFNYRTVRYRSSRAFIVSTDKVSADAKKVFAELNAPQRPSNRATRALPPGKQPVYIEGLDKVVPQFQEEVVRISSERASSYLQAPQFLTGLNLVKVVN